MEIRTETKVVEIDKCPTTLPPLPTEPPKRVASGCEQTFGPGSVCYAGIDGTRLGLLLDALSALYLEREACEHRSHADSDPQSPEVP